MDIFTEEFQKLELSGGKILDVGTGTGTFIPTFTENFKNYTEITGIDNSEKSIAIAQKNFNQPNIKFIQMDAENMSFEDNSMDTVCISNTLHHLPDFNKVLKEMLRVLKPGGLFIINEMFSDNQSPKQLSHVYIHHLFGEIDSLTGNYHHATFKKEEILEIANALGIKVEQAFEYSTAEEQEGTATEAEEKEVLDSCFESLDKYVEKINDKPQYENIKNKIVSLKQSLYKTGFMNSTELFILGRK